MISTYDDANLERPDFGGMFHIHFGNYMDQESWMDHGLRNLDCIFSMPLGQTASIKSA